MRAGKWTRNSRLPRTHVAARRARRAGTANLILCVALLAMSDYGFVRNGSGKRSLLVKKMREATDFDG
jgi:hypothetical protein